MTSRAAPRADAHTVYDQLRRDIVGGTIPAGAPVREVPVAERFGISRTPVREALRRLQHDRLLVPGTRGLRVRRPEPDEVVQVYDMRILLEAHAAQEAARARGPADVARLEGLLARDRALIEPPDAVRVATNTELHEAVWHAARNPVLDDLLGRLTVHLVHAPRSTLSVDERWAESLDEHARVVAAIARRDEAAAHRHMADHLRRARDLRLTLLREAVAADATGSTRPVQPG